MICTQITLRHFTGTGMIYTVIVYVFLTGYLVKMAYLLPLVNRNPWLDPSYDGHSTYSLSHTIIIERALYIFVNSYYIFDDHDTIICTGRIMSYIIIMKINNVKKIIVYIYQKNIRLTMMTVAQTTCMEAYCPWTYVRVVYLQLVIHMIALRPI